MGTGYYFAIEGQEIEAVRNLALNAWPADRSGRVMWSMDAEDIFPEVAQETAEIRPAAEIRFEPESEEDELGMLRVVGALLRSFSGDAALYHESQVDVLRRSDQILAQRDASVWETSGTLACLPTGFHVADIGPGGKVLRVYP
jgi:hypothetical protein